MSQGTEYEVDCIIYATGFNTVLPPFLAGRLRGHRPRRPDPRGSLGRGGKVGPWAHDPRLPEPLHPRAHLGGHPDRQRPPRLGRAVRPRRRHRGAVPQDGVRTAEVTRRPRTPGRRPSSPTRSTARSSSRSAPRATSTTRARRRGPCTARSQGARSCTWSCSRSGESSARTKISRSPMSELVQFSYRAE